MKFAELLRVFPGENDVGGVKTVCEGIFRGIRVRPETSGRIAEFSDHEAD